MKQEEQSKVRGGCASLAGAGDGHVVLIAGGAKLISAFGDATILKLPDPVLRLP